MASQTAHTTQSKSPFLRYTSQTSEQDLALLYLRRDLQIPVILSSSAGQDEGYSEGKVTNTRFGSFPHSTLLDVSWGSQIRASSVDTGSRGRRAKGNDQSNKKRKLDDATTVSDVTESGVKTPLRVDTGFVHIVPPTPENWTISLPHRTQVVYTHDSSYILNRLRVRPGTVIIEAGAGSGSFTHAACRAVYGHGGRVLSFEFHQQRYEKLIEELADHRVDDVVELRHRDVCQDGFGGSSHKASAIFLDLPAPWHALKHLTRNRPGIENGSDTSKPGNDSDSSSVASDKAIRICTFSPCIEQVQRTVSALRELGWLEIEMVEVSSRRLEVRRDRIGLNEEGAKGMTMGAANVTDAISRLAEIQRRIIKAGGDEEDDEAQGGQKKRRKGGSVGGGEGFSRQVNVDVNGTQDSKSDRKIHLEGNISHRAELELKTHTSYLVFALLPLEWSAADEKNAQRLVKEGSDKRSKEKEKKTMGKQKGKDGKGDEAVKQRDELSKQQATTAKQDETGSTVKTEE